MSMHSPLADDQSSDLPNLFPDLRIDRVETRGLFCLDGGEWEVDNNIWIIGDDNECYVIDAAHETAPIVDAVAGRKVLGILCTHGHNDHVNVAPELSKELNADIYLHPEDQVLWDKTWPDVDHKTLADGDEFSIGGATLQVITTPGHSPGSVCFYLRECNVLFAGDTLFAGGPGATGRSYSSFPAIIDSITSRLLPLPPNTKVFPGHGESTEIGIEAPHLDEWIDRGH